MNTAASGTEKTRSMAVIALMAAVICILGPLTLSIPVSPVPVSLANLAILFSVYILGAKRGTVSVLVYLLIGLAGVPVFSGFTGGAGKLLGPTGGYLIGYLFLAAVSGWFIDRFTNRGIHFLGMCLGTAVLYGFGTLWLARVAGMSFSAALAAGVLPFIPGDLVKMVIVLVAGSEIRRRLAGIQA